MPGSRKLSKVQLGLETTLGTKVAADTIWRGVGGMLDDTREIVFPDENVGILAGTDRSYTPKLEGAISLDDTEATYEQVPLVYTCGIEAVVTPAADGAGSGKIYQYDAATTAQNSVSSASIEGGDNQQEEEMEGAFVSDFSLTGAPGEAIKIQSNWIGRQVIADTFTGSISLPTVETMLFLNSKLYIDAFDGTIGSTQKSDTLLGFRLNWKTGYQAVYTGNGNLYYSLIKQVAPEIELEVTFEHDGSATAEKALWRSQATRLVRILTEGSTLTSAGTAYTKKSHIISAAGRWMKFEKLDERNGNDIVVGRLKVRYNATAALLAQIIVVNEVAGL
jgi:hypothetical protein